MDNEISMWNGYPVHGDAKELDRIIASEGLINLDKADVISALSAEGESHITSSINANLGDAFNNTINSLPCTIDKVNSLLIDLSCGNKQPKMSEISSIIATLSDTNPDIDVIWGMSSDETLGDSYKVTFLVSIKA